LWELHLNKSEDIYHKSAHENMYIEVGQLIPFISEAHENMYIEVGQFIPFISEAHENMYIEVGQLIPLYVFFLKWKIN
jgi:hypothetical protein